ncbi:MAG: sigma factor-like helix-turn-helix DNA-binding protein [Thermoguttaceae bacterium]
MTLEQELIGIFAATPSPRNREILIGYYGWQDGRQHTLTEVGTRFGITRERVRQICAKLTRRSKNTATAAPTMDRALATIADALPAAAAEIERKLVDQGLTAVGMSLESVAIAARLLGRQVRFELVTVPPNGRIAVRPEQDKAVAAIVDLAKKEVYFHGLTTVARIDRAVSSRLGIRAGSELVRQTLSLIDGLRWLDQPAGWFRLSPIERHGLPKAIDKVLAVAGLVTVDVLRQALSRNRRLWDEPPPENVLLEFCREMPGVRVNGNRIIADPPRDWKKSLTGVEAKLVAVLKEHGPVMERGAMEDLCVAGGMNRFSFHAFVSWSPVIAQYGHSVYGLLGSEVAPERVQDLLAERRAGRLGRRVLDCHGWTDDGRVWLRYRLSKAASTYAVITIPAALKKTVRGRFQFLNADGQEIGTLATKDGRAWGLGSFLRKQGAQIGDQIVLTLDLNNRTAVVTWDHDGDGQTLAESALPTGP